MQRTKSSRGRRLPPPCSGLCNVFQFYRRFLATSWGSARYPNMHPTSQSEPRWARLLISPHKAPDEAVHRPFPRHSRRCSRWPAEELKTPVIYGVHPVESAYAGNQNMVALITSVVRSRDVIAGLHLDHSPTFDKVVECIRDGYISVMFDGSTLPLEQNLQLTRDVVRVARLAGERRGRACTIGTMVEYGAEIENPHLADPAGTQLGAPRLLVLRFTCRPPLAPQPQKRRSIGLGFSALCRTI